MKKLVTVCWSYTVEADLPEGTDADDLDGFMLSESLAEVASKIVQEASNNINWKDGVITDVQDI